MLKKYIFTILFLFIATFSHAKPWLTSEEQNEMRNLIERNEATDIIGTGQEGPNKWGKQWWLMLVFQRASTGVSHRDATHGIPDSITLLQSLPNRINNYVNEGSIPPGLPIFPKNRGKIPFYWDKAGVSGQFADLMWLGNDGKLYNDQGMSTDSTQTYMYASRVGLSVEQVVNNAKMQMFNNQLNGEMRALSRSEVFP